MVTPAYTEISHFRAPFKNWPYLGMGPSTLNGFGAETGATATAADVTPDMLIDVKDGVQSFKPAAADAILQLLEVLSIVVLDDNNVTVVPVVPNDPREKAAAWVRRKLKEGKTVVAGTAGGAHMFVLPVAVDRYLQAVSGDAVKVAAAPGQVGAVLARPAGLAGMLGGPMGMAALALLAIGGAVFFFGKKKRHGGHATANPRRRRRSHRRW